jgi:acetyl-CoA carboxylase biotin carboxyl carrier protein
MTEQTMRPGEEPMAGPGPVEDLPPRDATETGDAVVVAPSDGDTSLLALIDRLTAILERSDLGEIEVAAGGTTIVLRAPSAIERTPSGAMTGAGDTPVAPAEPGPGQSPPTAPGAPAAQAGGGPVRPSVKAPLTGIFYGAPSPGATAYVEVGDHVSVGQIIGLIEAMKLFNEIKSDLAGRVVRVCADNGALVKAKQPLIEVDPA